MVERWHADKARAEKNADWHVWGSRIWSPALTSTVDGRPSVSWDTRHIVAKVRPIVTDYERPPSHEEVAKRIAECVTACRGIADPVDVMDRARSLLTDLVNGKADASDPRVLALLARVALPGAQRMGIDE